MFILKNAAQNIYRHKNKYIMHGILFFILILTASICVNIFIQMNKVTDSILREYAGVSKLESFKFYEDLFDLSNRFTKSNYYELKNIEHVDDIRFLKYNFCTNYLKDDNLKLEVTIANTEIKEETFVLGYNLSLIYLIPEEFDLESGRMFENDGECVISKNALAEDNSSILWNKTELGDKITIKNNDGIHKEFSVVGIQKQNADDTVDINRRMIHTTLEGAEYFDVIAGEFSGGISYEPIIIEDAGIKYPGDPDFNKPSRFIIMGYKALLYLDNPDNFFKVNSQLSNKPLHGLRFSLTPFFPDFRSLINMTRSLQDASTSFLIIIAFIIICVTIITTVILLNSRKYEMAVLRSVGMKKSRLILNYLIENLIFIWSITAVSLTAAQFIGPIFTNRVFDNMQSMVSVEMFKTLTQGANIELLLQNIGIVFGGMTVFVMLSLVLACINIIRFEPMKIFNKQY